MERPGKKHKRSGSVTVVAASPSVVAPRSMKRSMGPRPYGKFQMKKGKAEKKNLDTDIVAAGLSTIPSLATATPYCLNLFNNGSTAITVTGRQAMMRSLLLRMSIRHGISGTSSANPTSVRVLVLYDRQPSGALPAVATILGATTYGTASPLNLGYSDRFSVLLDEKFTLGGTYVTGTLTAAISEQPPAHYLDRYVKIGLPTETTTNFTGAIAGITTGSLILLAWSDIAAANNPPIVDCAMSRIRYTDN